MPPIPPELVSDVARVGRHPAVMAPAKRLNGPQEGPSLFRLSTHAHRVNGDRQATTVGNRRAAVPFGPVEATANCLHGVTPMPDDELGQVGCAPLTATVDGGGSDRNRPGGGRCRPSPGCARPACLRRLPATRNRPLDPAGMTGFNRCDICASLVKSLCALCYRDITYSGFDANYSLLTSPH